MILDSKIAVVTGASSGLGSAFSKALIDKGSTVYGLARSEKKLKKIQKEIGDKFIPVIHDVTDAEKLEYWVKHTFNSKHLPDILINNAGIGIFSETDQLSLDDWHTMVETNLSAVFYLSRLIIPLMKQNQSTNHIINIGSIAGKVSNPQLSGYNASKFGLTGFSESLMKEVRYDKIKVTCLFPGSTATNFFKNTGGSEAHANMLQPEDVADTLIHVLETPDNFLINEVVMRPLNPKPPED
ncbi:MAG TPA: SDR family NAD(P)-dependent oxidoreductase [Balneolales bacterium]|nr:SDR family NAD(P)-dependent oxidoreductase [Balneolales bacterium]